MQKESKIKPEFSTLSQTINILGSELGNVIKQQSGNSKYELVEEIRVNSKKYRSSKNSKFLNLIYERLKTLDENELLILTKSFTLFFYLSNIAEQVFREKFEYKIDKNDLDKNKESLIFSPVFTAHPTESARQSTLKKLYKIGNIISENKSSDLDEINNLITQLWYTREVRSTKPNPIDEVKTLLYYLNNLYTDVYDELNKTFAENNIAQKDIIRLGTWIGGDRDGNPFVTLKVTEEALKIYSNQIIQIYKEKIINLSESFSISTLYADEPKLLKSKIKEYSNVLNKEYRHYTKINFDEPFRIFLSLVFHRLDNFQKNKKGYNYFSEFQDDLNLFETEVNKCFKNNSPSLDLRNFVDYVNQFKFHGVEMDIRENADVFRFKENFKKQYSEFTNLVTPDIRVGDFVQALMDLGSQICKPSKPLCESCPLILECDARKNNVELLIPKRIKKNTKPTRNGSAFVIRNNDCVLIYKRKSKGLLAGLDSFPTFGWDNQNDERLNFLKSLNTNKKISNVKHEFTHFTLNMEIYIIDESIAKNLNIKIPDDFRWIPIESIQNLSFSSLMMKIYKSYLNG